MKASKRNIALVLCALLCLVLVAGACTPEEQPAQSNGNQPTPLPAANVVQGDEREPESISVTGAGKVMLAPDTATLYVSIASEAKDAAGAQSDNAEKVKAVTAAILAAGVEEKNLQTSSVNLYEDYDYRQSPAVLTGYRMETTLFVTVTPLEQAGKVIGQAIAAGATGTNGLAFTIADVSGAYQKALQAAIADAAGKAAAMAEALGVQISAAPLSVTEISRSSPVVYADMAIRDESMSGAAVDMPLSAGETTVSASVTVVYELLEPDAAP